MTKASLLDLSLAYVIRHPRLLIIPSLAYLIKLLCFVLFCIPLVHFMLSPHLIVWPNFILFFILYLLLLFSIQQMHIILYGLALCFVEKQYRNKSSLDKPFKTLFSSLTGLLLWNLYAKTVGLFVQQYRIRSASATCPWRILLYFALPFILFEKKYRPFSIVQDIESLLHKKWGRILNRNFGSNIVLFVFSFWMISSTLLALMSGNFLWIKWSLYFNGALHILLSTLILTAHLILSTALYHFAKENIIHAPFQAENLHHAFIATPSPLVHSTQKE